MDKFIQRENLALFRRRLEDPGLTYAQRKAVLSLLSEERVKSRDITSSAGRPPVTQVLKILTATELVCPPALPTETSEQARFDVDQCP